MKYTLQIFSMEADTGDFRTSERLLLVKRLSQATCGTAHIILNSVVLHNMHSREEYGHYGKKCTHRQNDSRREKTFECQTRDLSISLSTSDLVSLSAKGVASFICLHNCRPACLCVWHIVVKSTTLLLSNPWSHHKITQFFSLFSSSFTFSLTLSRHANENY